MELINVCKKIKNKNTKDFYLNNISFCFNDAGLYFITGKSGSGKSSLLRIIGLLDNIDDGLIVHKNLNLSALSNKEKSLFINDYIGFIFQDLNLFENLSVKDNILLRDANTEEYKKIIELVGLSNLENNLVKNLSGGQKQLVAIARALMKNSQIILCDEPTSSLDDDSADEIMKILKEISKNRLVIMVSHNLDLCTKYADHILQMDNGKLLTNSCHNNNEYDLCQKYIRQNKQFLSFKSIFKLSLLNFNSKKLRLSLTFIISSLLLTSVNIALSTANNNEYTMIAKSMINQNNNNIVVDLKKEIDGETAVSYINSEIIDNFKNDLKIDNVFPIYNYFCGNYSQLAIPSDEQEVCYTTCEGFAEINNECLNKCNFELVGNLPTTDNEVVITEYQYSLFKKYGYKYNNVITYINDFNDLIGKKLTISGNGSCDFTISGIIKTGLTIDKFTEFNNIEYINGLRNSYHNIIYLKEDFYKNKIQTNDDCSMISQASYLKNSGRNFNFEVYNDSYSYYYKGIIKNSYFDISYFDTAKSVLNENEILISASSTGYTIPVATSEYAKKVYCNEHVSDVSSQLINDYPNYLTQYGSLVNCYIAYLKSNNYVDEYRGLTRKEYVDEATSYLCKEYILKKFNDTKCTIDVSCSQSYTSSSEIVGIYLNYKDDGTFTEFDGNNYILMNENSFDIIRSATYYDFTDVKSIIVPFGNDVYYASKILEKIANYKSSNNNLVIFGVYSNEYTIEYSSNYYIIDNVIKYLKYVIPVIVIINTLFLIISIYGIFKEKKREIGILFSLGSSRINTSKVYLIQLLLLAIITIIFTLILSFASISIIGTIYSSKLTFILPYFSFNQYNALLTLITPIVSTILSYIFAIIMIYKLSVYSLLYDDNK